LLCRDSSRFLPKLNEVEPSAFGTKIALCIRGWQAVFALYFYHLGEFFASQKTGLSAPIPQLCL
jgi:hypothetical protein